MLVRGKCGLGGITFSKRTSLHGGVDKSNRDPLTIVFIKEDYDEEQDEITKVLEHGSAKLRCLLRALEILTSSILSKKQLEYLLMVQKHEGLLYYKLVQKLSLEHGLPSSTVRWNLNKLRDAKLIVAGDRNKKGVPVKLTREAGLIVSAYKNGSKNNYRLF